MKSNIMQEFNPVLVTGFNRPQHLEQLLSTLIALNCEIFISMDLAKPGDKKNQNLNQQCQEVIAKYLSNISAVNIAKENLGCFRAVTEGISWAFEKTESLIILEDDLFVDERFLAFASWALGEFKDDNSIGSISGTNLYPFFESPEMARLSIYTSSWGWATWRNRWEDYMCDLIEFPDELNFDDLPFEMNKFEKYYWMRVFNKVKHEKIDSWAYRWLYSNWNHRRLTVVPNRNLVINMGFGEIATHTFDRDIPWWLPLEISKDFRIDFGFGTLRTGLSEDLWMKKFHFRVGFWQQIRNRLHSINPRVYLRIKAVISIGRK